MAIAARLSDLFPMAGGVAVPGARRVPDLAAALGLVRRAGGSIASEMRTAPGIGSWAFVTDRDGSELLLWENAESNRA